MSITARDLGSKSQQSFSCVQSRENEFVKGSSKLVADSSPMHVHSNIGTELSFTLAIQQFLVPSK